MAIDLTEQKVEFTLSVEEIAKNFHHQKLFKNINFTLRTNDILAVTGPNGSGKSTLLQIIAGLIPPQKGKIKFYNQDKEVTAEYFYKHVNICAPSLQLIEDFTLEEHLNFHEKFKNKIKGIEIDKILEESGLNKSKNKPVSNFSSGMKQRLKLILALCFEGQLVLLDEPTSHLDEKGKLWYRDLVRKYTPDRICIIFSNEEEEYTDFSNNFLNIEPIN